MSLLRRRYGESPGPRIRLQSRRLLSYCDDAWNLRDGLSTLPGNSIEIGAKLASRGRYVVFRISEIAVQNPFFSDIPRMIAERRLAPAASTA